MKKLFAIPVFASILFIVYSCNKFPEPSGSNSAYLDKTYYSSYYIDNTNQANEKANLGRVLFYDKHMSINNSIACGSCHKQESAFSDNTAFSTGYEGHITGRNSPAIQNLVNSNIKTFSLINSNFNLFWDGRENNIEHLIARPMTNHVEMGITDFSALSQKLSQLPYYSDLFTAAYGDNNINEDRISECVAAFITAMTSNGSRFDAFLNTGAPLSGIELRGYNLFTSTYNCDNCHHIFTNSYGQQEAFRDIGLDANYTDNGRGKITGLANDNGKFKVPHLNNIALTAPYMHDGRYKTLDEVIDHYSNGIQDSPNLDTSLCNADKSPKHLNISEDDKKALIAFLNTMTDNTFITDPKFSDPFKQK